MTKNTEKISSVSSSNTNEDLTKLTVKSYDKAAKKFNDYYYHREGLYRSSSVRLGLISFVKRLPKKGLVLDIGCGPGVHLNFISKSTRLEVIGIDLSSGMLQHVRNQFPTAKLLRMDVRNLAIRDCCCDGIWSSFLVHHIPKAEIPFLFHEWYRIAKPGCIVYIITSRGSNERVIRTQSNHFSIGPRFVVGLQEAEIQTMMDKAKFEVLNIKVSDEDFIHLSAKKSSCVRRGG